MQKATRRQTKAHNDRLVLKTIYDLGETSRADIARTTGLARTTVSDAVAGWIEDGLIAEVGTGPSAGGKPPIMLSVVDASRSLIGVDLSGSTLCGAVVDLRGRVRQRCSRPIAGRLGDAALGLVYDLLDQLVALGGASTLGIGIGVPGLMDARQGVVHSAVNLDWRDLPLGDLVEERYGVPTYIANDCQAAALAECVFGCGRDVDNLVVIKIDRGLGSGIVFGRKPYHGDGFGAGEIGHVVVVEGGAPCRCGNRGCLETLVNRRAIVERARAWAEHHPDSILNQLAGRSSAIELEDVIHAFEAGDPGARAIVDEVGAVLGRALTFVVSALNIRHIVLAGSVARFGEGLIAAIRRQLDRRVLAPLATGTEIAVTSLDADIVILGAAALLLTHELGLV
ncbi:MAG: ROK family transcriptional regulator [Anaerolineae bacterium]|nr:ROK family transcriptional regulator [Anaerolineae bacterium]